MNRILILAVAAAIMAAAGAVLASCGAKRPQGPKSLIVYYSQSGATEQVAKLIQEKTGADIATIVPVTPYDGDYQSTIERCRKERTEGIVPEVLPLGKDLADYDTLYIGFPVWFGTYALPVAGFLKDLQLEGKVIVPFCTFGSGGIESATADLEKALPGATFVGGYGVRNARIAKASAELDIFLVGIGVKKGEPVELPAFGNHASVTEEDIALFNEACGDYPMPLGTPVSVARRDLEDGVEYRFAAESQRPDGIVSVSTIFVVKGPEGRAEFTRVIR